VHQYGELTKTIELDTLVKRILAARDRFPFTGMEIALMAVGVLVLAGPAWDSGAWPARRPS